MPGTRVEGMMRVASGDIDGSLLHRVLAEGGEGVLRVNHVEILSSHFGDDLYGARRLADDWIRSLGNGD